MNGRSVWSPPRPRLFFMRLPKTAGMALRLFLGNQYPVDRIMPANDWRELLSVDLWDLQQYSLFQGHFSCGLMDLLPADAVPIVFLREPVARTISHLKHMRRDPSFSSIGYKLAAGRSLDELVHDEFIMKLCCDVQSSLLCNYISGPAILAGLRRDQMAGNTPNPDAFSAPPDLAAAEESLERFRFIGLVEDFQEDILRLSLELGLHPPLPLPKRNFDPGGETDPNALAPETLAIIRQCNPVDVALYAAVKARLAKRPRLTRDAVGSSLLARGIYRPIAEPVEFAMTGPIPGSNWYACEAADRGGHRWTGPLAATTFELPLASGFDFEFAMHVLITDLADFAVHIGDSELPIRRDASEGRMHRIAFRVPAEHVAADALTTLRFETREVFQPSADDLRLLSFLVRSLAVARVEPAAATPSPPRAKPGATAKRPARGGARRRSGRK
jgi:hypothetical protein